MRLRQLTVVVEIMPLITSIILVRPAANSVTVHASALIPCWGAMSLALLVIASAQSGLGCKTDYLFLSAACFLSN